MNRILMTSLAAALVCPAASAEVFFTCPLNDSPAADVRLDITPRDGGFNLEVINRGPPEAVVVGVYFDDRHHLITDAAVVEGPGVSFQAGGSPPNLPEGHTLQPPFESDLHFTAEAPPPKNGVGPGERLTLRVDVRKGQSLQDVLDGLASGSLRIGVRAIAGPGAADVIARGCAADLDCSGSVDDFDFLAFQNAYAKGERSADLDGNGELDVFDFLTFLNEFNECQ
jgi:hypothetical protein